ncbi:MAG: hypothetical protein WA840_16920 [Caulobacteraceae bacterium]
MSVLLFVALAAVATGTPDAATPAKPDAAATPSQTSATSNLATADADQVVCQRVEVTGSRFATKTCHTRAQWKQMSLDAQDAIRHTPINASGK